MSGTERRTAMMNQIQTVRYIFNRREPGEPLEMHEIQRLMREVNPHLPFTEHGPYSCMETLVDSGELIIVRTKPRLAWARTRKLEEQALLPLEEPSPNEAGTATDRTRVAPYALQDAVRGIVANGAGRTFTSAGINTILRQSHPELWRTMSPSSTSSTLAALEHEGVIERTGRRRGRCIEWMPHPQVTP